MTIIKKICHIKQARKRIKSWMFFFPPLTSTYHSTSSSLLSFSTLRIHHSHLFPHNWIFINFQFINHVHIFQFSCRFYWLKDFIWFLMRLSMCRWWKVYSYFSEKILWAFFYSTLSFLFACVCGCMGKREKALWKFKMATVRCCYEFVFYFCFLWLWNGTIR